MIIGWKYRISFILFLFLTSGKLVSQEYGNEWINYNQDFYKITLAKTGIYRITYQDLNNAGFPVSSVDPRRIQMFHRGEEVAINITGQLDAVFNEEDYIGQTLAHAQNQDYAGEYLGVIALINGVANFPNLSAFLNYMNAKSLADLSYYFPSKTKTERGPAMNSF